MELGRTNWKGRISDAQKDSKSKIFCPDRAGENEPHIVEDFSVANSIKLEKSHAYALRGCDSSESFVHKLRICTKELLKSRALSKFQ